MSDSSFKEQISRVIEKIGKINNSKKRVRRSTVRIKRRRRLKRGVNFYIAGAVAACLSLCIISTILFHGISYIRAKSGITSFSKVSESSTSDSFDASVAQVRDTPVSITVNVVGDCTFGKDEKFPYSTSFNAYYDAYGKDYFLWNVREIFSADDLTIANFEGTLTTANTRAEKQFAFKAPPEFVKILSSGSVEAVNMANNHSRDYGEGSFSDTLSTLDAEGIVHFGYEETAIMDIKGVKVGLVGIYELRDHIGCAQQLKTNISKVKSEGAELIIVIFHWGNELDAVPTETQMTLGRMAVDEGADLVCGHHPHVLQGIETYQGKNIVYSLGNFCFGGNSSPRDKDTMIFQQTFTVDADGVHSDNVTKIIPCSISSRSGYNNYKPTPSQGSEYDRIMQKIEYRSSLIPVVQ